MGTLRFLHLTDLHFGMAGQTHLWPNVEERVVNDLKSLHDRIGPWDLVLFTGDLTQRGSAAEFAGFEKLMLKLWQQFQSWGFAPKLLAIPGNHDLVRPSDEADPALINLLHSWNLPDVANPFWDKADSPQRKLIVDAFQNFTNWWETTAIPKPVRCYKGMLPGDCSATVEHDGIKLGVVGLNSAYLQLAKGDFTGRLHLDGRQFQAACTGHAPDWLSRHDVNLLLSHHAIEWLTPEARQHFLDEIHSPPERFALHLFGHMHEGILSSVASGGGRERRRLQGPSLFGMEHWLTKDGIETRREHGYALCELQCDAAEIRLRVWPRRAISQSGGGRKIVPDHSFDLVELDGGTPPVVVKHLVPAPITPPTQPPERSAVTGHVADYGPHHAPFYVPYRQKGDQVIGRETALEKVRAQLTAGRSTAIGQTALFQGLGGLGKTQLAVEYAYRYRDEYPNGVIWLTADQDIDAQLSDLAVKARWVAPESEHKFKLEIARHRLRSHSGCLIVFDNLEHLGAIQAYLPESPAEPHILVTSRTEQAEFTYVPIDLLDPEQSMRLLIQEAGRMPEDDAERAAAEKLVERLAGLPLALELAGAYLARRPVGWRQYLDLLEHNLKEALPSRLASLTRHEADLYSTLRISAEVFAEEPLLESVLDLLTWSAAAPMAVDLMAALIGVPEHELVGALGLGTALRLLQPTPVTKDYAVHRLVREVRREQIPLAGKVAWVETVCRHIGDWFFDLREDYRYLPRFEAAIDHLREWHGHVFRLAPVLSSRLAWLEAYPAYHRGQPHEIKRLLECAYDEYLNSGCQDRGLLAHLLADQAYAIDALGEPKRALALAEQALAIQRELYGERNLETTRSLSNVAGYTEKLGDPRRALKMAEQALAIQREMVGDGHRETIRSLNNLASYTNALGDHKHALELAEQALTIQRNMSGDRHPVTAIALSSVASYTNELGDHKHALELAEQALAIKRELFGERHPHTALSLSNVAIYVDALGDPKRALDLAEQALAIQRELFGECHPDIANSLHNIAGCELALNKTGPAYAHAKMAYELERQLFGSSHPNTIRCAQLLARIDRPGFRKPSSKKGGGKKRRY